MWCPGRTLPIRYYINADHNGVYRWESQLAAPGEEKEAEGEKGKREEEKEEEKERKEEKEEERERGAEREEEKEWGEEATGRPSSLVFWCTYLGDLNSRSHT